MKKKYLLILEFAGTGFSGSQKQPGRRTVQGTVEDALAKLEGGRPVPVRFSSRLDAGVHAEKLPGLFESHCRFGCRDLKRRLNLILPEDIKVVSIRSVHDGFDPRRDAKWKRYAYRISSLEKPSPAASSRCWWIKRPLDVRTMRLAAAKLSGIHDFNNFVSTGGGSTCSVTELYRISVSARKGLLTIVFKGRNFYYKMVRNLTGYLVETGLGRIPKDDEPFSSSRGRQKFTVPACGLTLEKVGY